MVRTYTLYKRCQNHPLQSFKKCRKCIPPIRLLYEEPGYKQPELAQSPQRICGVKHSSTLLTDVLHISTHSSRSSHPPELAQPQRICGVKHSSTLLTMFSPHLNSLIPSRPPYTLELRVPFAPRLLQPIKGTFIRKLASTKLCFFTSTPSYPSHHLYPWLFYGDHTLEVLFNSNRHSLAVSLISSGSYLQKSRIIYTAGFNPSFIQPSTDSHSFSCFRNPALGFTADRFSFTNARESSKPHSRSFINQAITTLALRLTPCSQ